MNENTAVSGGTGYRAPTLNRAVVSDFQIYEVKDHELETLREGKDGGVYLNIAISCFSIAISLFASIFCSEPQSEVAQAYLNCAIIGALLIGGIFLYLMRKSKTKVDTVYKEILSRKYLESPPSKPVASGIEAEPKHSPPL